MNSNRRYFGKKDGSSSKWPMRIDRKITIMLAVVPLIITLLYFPIPFSPAVTQTPDPHIVAAYVIFKNSTATYAKNGNTGVIEFNNTDSRLVVQNAVNALPPAGGKIVMLAENYTFTSPVTISKNDIWIQGIGGGLDDNLGKGTTLKRTTSNAFFTLQLVGGNDLYGFHLSDLALEGQISDTVDMINSTSFCGSASPEARGIQKAIFENIGIKNLAPNISGIKLNNPDNGVIINNIHGAGGASSDTLGKLIHLRSCGRTSGNLMITNIDDSDMKDPHSAAIYIERDPTYGKPMNRVDIKHVHGFGGSGSTATNATVIVIKESGASYSLEDIRVEHARLLQANGDVVSGGLLQDISIRDAWGSDTRSTIGAQNKIMFNFGNLTRNVLMSGVILVQGHTSAHVGTAIMNNATNSPINWVDPTNVHYVDQNFTNGAAVDTKIGGTGYTQLKTPANMTSCSYQIFVDGSNYLAKNSNTAQIDFGGTNASSVINSAISALGSTGGNICIDTGNYSLSGEIQIQPNQNKIKLIGAGQEQVVLDQTRTSYNVIHVKSADFIEISGMSLKLKAGSATGDGILIEEPAASGFGSRLCTLQDLRIYNGDVGHWGINAENLYECHVEKIEVRDGVNGIRLTNNDTVFNNGNSVFENIHILLSGSSAGTALRITNAGNLHSGVTEQFNLNNFNNVNVYVTTWKAGSVGIEVNGDYNWFFGTDIERVDTAIKVVDGNSIDFFGGFIQANGTSGAINVQSFARNFHMSGFEILPSVGLQGLAINDAVSTAGGASVYEQVRIGNFNSTKYSIQANNTKFYGVTVPATGKYSENGGTATLTGNNSTKVFTISHALMTTPIVYEVTANSAGGQGDFFVTASATQLTITFKNPPPTGTFTMIWRASVTPT